MMEAPWAVLVSGSRDLGKEHFSQVFDYLKAFGGVHTLVIHGDGHAGRREGAIGCDRLADRAAERLGFRIMAVPALWHLHPHSDRKNPAGPIRNRLMLEILCAHHAAGYRLAAGFFPTGGPGTAGMMRGTRSVTTVPIQISEFPIELV